MRVHVGYTRLPGLFQVDSVFVFFGEGGVLKPHCSVEVSAPQI